ncbi:MAG: hypothetical protein RSB71_01285 [Bacilli bacterium]
MKKMTKIIPIIMIVLLTALTLIYIDFKEANVYLNFKQFDRGTMSIEYNNDNGNFINNVKEIQSIAKKNNVILAKSNIDNKKENGVNVYISLETINEMCELLNKNFKIKKLNDSKNKTGFISTYNNDTNNQIGLINDLFGDHYYSYYLMDEMIEKNDNMFGEYFIFYTNFQDYSNFMNDVNNFMGVDMRSTSLSNGVQGYIGILIIGSAIFLFLFYLIFQVYEYNNDSKKIGCMRLLGFDMQKINKNMIIRKLKIYCISLILTLLLAIVFIKNITFYHLILLLGVDFIIILVTYLISLLSCIIINKNYQITNILKMQNITLKISKVSYIFKTLMTMMLLCFFVITFKSVLNLSDKLKSYNESKNLLNYGIFQSYVANQPEAYDYNKQYNLYLNIINNMETFYAQFNDYSQYTTTDWKNIKSDEKNGKFYIYDSIDKNYIKKENIKIYDLDNNEVDINSIQNIFFLFPKSKKNQIDVFEKFNSDTDEYYLKFNSKYTFNAYLYDDQKIDTYQINYKYIESPILRVIDTSLKKPYFADGLGISLFGNGLITGLKIKLIDDDKEKTMETLSEYIDKSEMTNLFGASSFITYNDYFNDEIIASELLVLFSSLAIVLILGVYILISLQLIKLFIKGKKKDILVKKLLGFDNNIIFEKLYRKNLNNTILSIILSFIILIIFKQINISFGIIALVLLILDFITTLISIKSMKLSSIYLDLKGGTYD